jgi:hypothetical protein
MHYQSLITYTDVIDILAGVFKCLKLSSGL